MRKIVERWRSSRLQQPVQLVRWGHFGTPVLLFPTAGGDAEEVERFQLISALEPLIEAGRIKVYSTDSIPGRLWMTGAGSGEFRSRVQNLFDAFIYAEVLPAIRKDCRSSDIEVVTAGASIGAFNAVATVCRHPDAFRLAIAMSGTYDLSRFLDGSPITDDFYFSSPIHFVPGLDGLPLHQLGQRFLVLACGEGPHENIDQSWRLADVLGSKGIPNRVDNWGPEHRHDWVTWREMLPGYLAEYA